MKRAPAFTLIEMLAVIAVMASLTAAAAVSLSGAARTARVEDVAGALTDFDRNTREIARRFERTPALRFDLNRGTVERLDGERQRATRLAIAATVRAKRVIVRGEDYASGEISLPYSTLGQSPSYAVLLAGEGGERWVAFAGLTGQSMVLSNEREVQDIFALPGADAR